MNTISISRDEQGTAVWVGDGRVTDDGRIIDCAATLADEIYEAIEAEIDGPGEYAITVDEVTYCATVAMP